MNIQDVGAIGELIAAFAVVVSLVYLAVQLKAQNRESRISSMHDIAVGYREVLGSMSDGVMPDVLDKAIVDFDSLSQSETLRLIAGVGRIFRVWEEAFLLFEAGNLEERTWETMLRQFNGYMSIQPFAEVWAVRKQYFDAEFQMFVDGLERVEYTISLHPREKA
jgi:hypothetical protein